MLWYLGINYACKYQEDERGEEATEELDSTIGSHVVGPKVLTTTNPSVTTFGSTPGSKKPKLLLYGPKPKKEGGMGGSSGGVRRLQREARSANWNVSCCQRHRMGTQ